MRFRLRRQPARIQAAEVNKWNKIADQAERGVLVKLPDTPKVYDPSSRVAYCKNVSGSDRAQFETMSISGLTWDLETDGTSALLLELDTADPDEPPAVLTTPIADGETGLAVIDGLALALVSGGTGLTGIPDATNHNIEPDATGNIRLLTAPHATADRLLPVVIGSTGITDLRLDGNNLQFKKNGTWTTWHTGTDCP